MNLVRLLNRRNIIIAISGLIVLFLICLNIYLISKTFVVDADGKYRTAVIGYGDIPLHLTQVSKFAYGGLDDLDEPIYLGEKIKYPFVINLVSGLLFRATDSLRFSFLFPVFILATLNILLIFGVYKKLLKNYLVGALAVVIFLLGSGFGVYSFIEKAVNDHQSIPGLFRELTDKSSSTVNRWDAAYPDQNINFGAPLSLVFLHQRPFFLGLFGLLLTLLTLHYLRQKGSWRFGILGAAAYGFLPLMHAHSFVAASVMLFSFFIVAWRSGDRVFAKRILYLTAVGLIVALPQFLYLLGSKNLLAGSGSFLHFRLGWMVAPTIGSLQLPVVSSVGTFIVAYGKFLLVNLGILFSATILCFAVVFLQKKFRSFGGDDGDDNLWLWSFSLSATLLFVVLQIIRFQPWDYDNNKILVYWQLFSVPVVAYFFNKLIQRKKNIGVVAFSLFFIISIFSGTIDQIPRIKTPSDRLPVIFDNNARQLAEYVMNNIPKDNIILTGSSHLNPVASLVGRSALVGYPGWLWTRGIDYASRDKEIRKFYAAPSSDSKLLSEFKIEYVLVDDQVIYDFKAKKADFERLFVGVFRAGQYSLYKL